MLRNPLNAFCVHTHVSMPASRDGALSGASFAVKDVFDIAGHRTGNGSDWRKVCSFETAGYNHNVFGGFLSLRPAIFAMGKGQVIFKDLSYKAD